MKEAVIVAGVRTAVGKAHKGSLRHMRAEDLGGIVIETLVRRVSPFMDPAEIEDVIIGCAMPEGEQGMNLGRVVAQRAGLPNTVPGMTVNRFCSSGLQSIALAAQQIMTGQAEIIVAGGVESMSHVPMTGFKWSPNPWLAEHKPELYMAMGHTAEQVAKRFHITREAQDAFAFRSHQRAAAAIGAGLFREEIVPVHVQFRDWIDGKVVEEEFVFEQDEGVRSDTSLESLARLKPVFHIQGTVTAGNSSQMSDGAAAVLVMSAQRAAALGLQPLAVLRSFAVGGVDPDIMGVGPVVAIPKALRLAGLKQEEIDLFEINEAFAAQAVYVVKHLGLDQEKVNVNGGAIALGHPLGCTGTKLTVSLIHELRRRNAKYGVVSMCIGGGMGAAGVLERV